MRVDSLLEASLVQPTSVDVTPHESTKACKGAALSSVFDSCDRVEGARGYGATAAVSNGDQSLLRG